MSDIKRIAKNKLERLLSISGAVLVIGPKWCGKTFLSKQFANDYVYLQSMNIRNEEELLNIEYINSILEGDKPKLIDEWQLIPQIWDQVRHYIDQSSEKRGLFILTGSTTPIKNNKINHSGAGRISRLNLKNLSVYEILQDKQNDFISLNDLLHKQVMNNVVKTNYNFKAILDQMLFGFWPEIIASKINTTDIAENYVESILDIDTKKINGLNKNRNIFKELLKSFSRLNTSQIKYSTLLNDINNGINEVTLKKYIEIIESLFLVDYLYPWSKNFRSKSKVRVTPKTYLFDPSIGLHLLGVKNSSLLLNDLNTLGIYFENVVFNNLKIYADNLGANLYFYRDNNGFEIDVIIELDNEKWGAIEIKLGDSQLDKAANNLLKFSKKINSKTEPSFLAIITSGNTSYRRDDGVYIIPLGCLGP